MEMKNASEYRTHASVSGFSALFHYQVRNVALRLISMSPGVEEVCGFLFPAIHRDVELCEVELRKVEQCDVELCGWKALRVLQSGARRSAQGSFSDNLS